MKLKASEFEQLRDALRDAFNRACLRTMASTELSLNLDEMVIQQETFEGEIEELIHWAERNDCVEALITGARKSNPNNKKLAAVEAVNLIGSDNMVEKREVLPTDVPGEEIERSGTRIDQEGQLVSGRQVNIGEVRGDIGQIGDVYVASTIRITEGMRELFFIFDVVLLSKLGKSQVAAPDFRDRYIIELTQPGSKYQGADLQHTMAGTYAGPVSRLMSFIVDVVVLWLAFKVIYSLTSVTLRFFNLHDLISSLTYVLAIETAIRILVTLLLPLLIYTLYFIISWHLTGFTIGNAILGLQVVSSNDGGQVSSWRSVFRMAGVYLSAMALMLGFIWALFDGRRQGWHDKFGGTFVLYAWPAKLSDNFLLEYRIV